jgi:predicted nucleotidyltransferase
MRAGNAAAARSAQTENAPRIKKNATFASINNINMKKMIDEIEDIKESILKFVPAKSIYLFGSYAYGTPTDKSDIDIYTVIPDGINNLTELYAKIIVDLSYKKIYLIDLFLNNESTFNKRKTENRLENTIYQKGTILYEYQ